MYEPIKHTVKNKTINAAKKTWRHFLFTFLDTWLLHLP